MSDTIEKFTVTNFAVSYVASAMALGKPFLNSAGSNVTATATLTGLEFSFLSIFIMVAWFLSGFVNAAQRHGSIVLCLLNALGIPGLVLAVLGFVS